LFGTVPPVASLPSKSIWKVVGAVIVKVYVLVAVAWVAVAALLAVIVVVPAATSVTAPVLAFMVAVAGVPLEYVIAPVPTPLTKFVYAPLPSIFDTVAPSAKTIVEGVSAVTVKVYVPVTAAWVAVAALLAVITVVPAATSVIAPVLAFMEAVPGVPLEYVIAPVPTPLTVFEYAPLPNIFDTIAPSAKTMVEGVSAVTVKVYVPATAAWVAVAALLAVITVVPAATSVIAPVLAFMVAVPGVPLEYVIAPVPTPLTEFV